MEQKITNTTDNTKNKNIDVYNFETEVSSLLDLLANYLYSSKDIFLRELISNAADSLSKIKFESLTNAKLLKADEELKITISIDEKEKTMKIVDNGIGMTKQELIDNLGTIAKSGTGQFIKKLSENKDKMADLIGKFGVGFYSVFMVTDKVTVKTKSLNEKGSTGYMWVSEGKNSFSIEPLENINRGFEISFKFKESVADMCSKFRIENIIREHSSFIPFNIELDGKQINKKEALWAKPKNQITEKEYQDFFNYLKPGGEAPRFTYHYKSDVPLQFDAVLFVPKNAERNLFNNKPEINVKLYSRKVFIQSNCKELLPSWLRFIEGVVDAYDLPLNVSRTNLQESPVLHKIKSFLVKKLLQAWEKLKEKDEKEFHEFWENFGVFIKEGIYGDFENRDALIKLYHAESSTANKLISLSDYVANMNKDQKNIYYITGKNRSHIEGSPNLEYFKKNNIEVLYLYEDFDDFVISSIGNFEDKPIVSIDKANIEIDNKSDDKPDEKSANQNAEAKNYDNKLKEYFKDMLADKVDDVVVSKRLFDSPCTLVAANDGPTAGMEKLMKIINKEYVDGKKIMEINFEHPILKNLSQIREKFPQDKFLKETIEMLYDNCLIIKSGLENSSDLFNKINKMLATSSTLYLKSLMDA